MKQCKFYKKYIGFYFSSLLFCKAQHLLLLLSSLIPLPPTPRLPTSLKLPPTLKLRRTGRRASRDTVKSLPQNLIVDTQINAFIKEMVEDAAAAHVTNKISPSLRTCYKTLINGKNELSADDLWNAMPDLLHYALQLEKEAKETRAIRNTTSPFIKLLDILPTTKRNTNNSAREKNLKNIITLLDTAQSGMDQQSELTHKITEVISKILNDNKVTSNSQDIYDPSRQEIYRDICETPTELCELECLCLPATLTQADVDYRRARYYSKW